MRLPTRKTGRLALLAAALPLAFACSDQGPLQAPAETRVVGAQLVSIGIGETHEVTVECLNGYGQVLSRTATEWVVPERWYGLDRPGRIALDWQGARARVRGISEGPVRLVVGCVPKKDWRPAYSPFGGIVQDSWDDERLHGFEVHVTAQPDTAWSIDAIADTVRLRAPSLEDSTTAVTRLLTARSGIGSLSALAPSTFTWSSEHPDVASVSADGLVRATGIGVTAIRASRAGRSRFVPVRVSEEMPANAWDIALLDAHWTQGAQDSEQRVPIVRNGRAAAVNITAFATPGAPAATVTLEVWNAAGALVHRANVVLQPTTDSAPSFAAPSAQFLVPREVVRVAARWRVGRDTVGARDADASNDRWPRTGTTTLNAITAAPLHLRLVPFRLAGDAFATAEITAESRVYYDSVARIRLPLADVVVSVEPPLTLPMSLRTPAEWADHPSYQAKLSGMYNEMLESVDRRRLLSGTARGDYWVGVVPRSTPDAVFPIGGMAYIPSRPGDMGPMSRTMIVRSHEWYQFWSSTSNHVAHELGHNLGLSHAPCGDTDRFNFDPAYPTPGGGVGEWVHWVSRWEHGTSTYAETIAPEIGDFMGYCPGNFASPYHTRAIIEWRTMAGANLMMAITPERVLAVRGVLSSSEIIVRTPEIIDAEPVLQEGGDVRIELLAADGRVLAQGSARTGRLAESPDIPFVAHIPLAASWATEVASVRVSSTRLNRQVVTPVP